MGGKGLVTFTYREPVSSLIAFKSLLGLNCADNSCADGVLWSWVMFLPSWIERLALDLDFCHCENWNIDPFKIRQAPGKVRQTKILFVHLTIRLQYQWFQKTTSRLSSIWALPWVNVYNSHVFNRINHIHVSVCIYLLFCAGVLIFFTALILWLNIVLGDLTSESKTMSPLLLCKAFC